MFIYCAHRFRGTLIHFPNCLKNACEHLQLVHISFHAPYDYFQNYLTLLRKFQNLTCSGISVSVWTVPNFKSALKCFHWNYIGWTHWRVEKTGFKIIITPNVWQPQLIQRVVPCPGRMMQNTTICSIIIYWKPLDKNTQTTWYESLLPMPRVRVVPP